MSCEFVQVTAGERESECKLRFTGGAAEMLGRGINRRPQWFSGRVESMVKLLCQLGLVDAKLPRSSRVKRVRR